MHITKISNDVPQTRLDIRRIQLIGGYVVTLCVEVAVGRNFGEVNVDVTDRDIFGVQFFGSTGFFGFRLMKRRMFLEQIA